jgi:cytochrome c oxidase subunit 2
MTRGTAILVVTLGAAGCGGAQSALDPAGPQARTIASLTWGFFAVCGVVYLITIGLLAWALWRRRDAGDDTPETAARLGRLVAGAVLVSIATLVVLVVTSVSAGRGLTSPSGPGAVTVDVIGHQWWWEFRYHDEQANEAVNAPNELHIPVGVPVVIRAMSRDVIHSFWAPRLNGKRDLFPGFVTHTWMQADEPGTYRGQCAEFCGHQHAKMAFLVVAEPMDRFQRWLQQQRRGATQPSGESQQRGHDVFMRGSCVLCHTIRGTPAGSRVGPDLTHLASRQMLAAGTLPMTRDHLRGWVSDPQAVKPGVRMPPNPLSDNDLQALLAYLETLR